MGACGNICKGVKPKKAAIKTEKAPYMEENVAKPPHMMKKAPPKKKNIAKRSPHAEKVAKRPLIITSFI